MMPTGPDNNKPLLVVVTGATASGKTGVALRLAQHYKTEILSADSRQCYREMTIGVAKPSPFELNAVPHHFIDSHSIHQKVDAASYQDYALEVLNRLFAENNIAIAAGGTGLYIQALCEGVDPMPVVQDDIREKVRNVFRHEGLIGLLELLKLADPLYYSEGEIKNPHRVMRALEICLSTGQSIKHYQQKQPKHRPFRTLYLGMEVHKDILHDRINNRVIEMMQAGLVDEVKQLLPYRNVTALQTVGYKEIFEFYDGKFSLEDAVESIKIHTRQYAKRQLTWFRKIPDMKWIAPENLGGMIGLIDHFR